MADTVNANLWPLAGAVFEDILDGYFPLVESARLMLARQVLSAMWTRLAYAPVMTIEGLAPTAPVPMSVRKDYAGMIEHMTLFVFQSEDGVHLSGTGHWFWVDGRMEDATLPETTRLGEPAFVRGIGVCADQEKDAATLALVHAERTLPHGGDLDQIAGGFGWHSFKSWALETRDIGVSRGADDDLADGFHEPFLSTKLPVTPAFSDQGHWNQLLLGVPENSKG